MPQSKQSDHIVLKDSSGTNVTGIRLMQDEGGALRYGWELAPGLPPMFTGSQVSYAEVPADQETVWDMRDWSSGALRFYYDPSAPAQYALADKVWALTPNELSLSSEPIPVSLGVPNGTAEVGSTSPWTASGITLTAATTSPHTGIYHFSMASMGENDYASIALRDEVAGSAAVTNTWQGLAIVVSAYVRRASSSGGTIRVQIVESGGSSTPTTNGTASGTLTTTYERITAGVTLQADTTGVAIRIQRNDAGSDSTFYLDAVTAGVTMTPATLYPRMVFTTDGLFAATDQSLYMWNETYDYFALVKGTSVPITGLEVFDDRIFIGLGESVDYIYSDAGAPTNWNTVGSSARANRFIKTLNVAGNWALARTLNDDEVYLNTDPTSGSAWGSAIEVGKDDHGVVNVHQINESFGVGKQDGFYIYRTLSGNRFANVFPAAGHVPSGSGITANFNKGITLNGYFYTRLAELGFVRWDGVRWESLSHLIQSPGFSQISHQICDFGTDGEWLYLTLKEPGADSDSRVTWLLALKETGQGWVRHTVTSFISNDTSQMAVFKPSGATNFFLYINCRAFTVDIPHCYRLRLPNMSNTPRLASNAGMAFTGTFITSYWDGNRAEVQKSLNKVTLLSESLSADLHVKCEYQLDNETGFTELNSSDAIFNTSPQETISADQSNRSFRRIRFRFTLTTNSSTSSPVIRGFVAGFSWRPTRLKRWRFVGYIEDDLTGLQGARNLLSAKVLISQLNTLKEEVVPITMQDIDGTSQSGHIVELSESQFKVVRRQGGRPVYTRGVALTFQEASTS